MVAPTQSVNPSLAPSSEAIESSMSGPDRIDGYMLLAVGALGTLFTVSRIDWVAFFLLFWVIDVIGYWPGAIAARLTGNRQLPDLFVHLYNFTHSTAGALAIGTGYCLLAPDTAASALAIAVHLGIDRGILANRLKRPGQEF